MKPLWCYLHKQDINMQRMFEGIVKYFCQEIRRFRIEFLALEAALKKLILKNVTGICT